LQNEDQPTALEKPPSPPPYDSDKVMTEAEVSPPPALSIIEDCKFFLKKKYLCLLMTIS
jgi:ubiquitin carboxyl-terminal hydrolase 7